MGSGYGNHFALDTRAGETLAAFLVCRVAPESAGVSTLILWCASGRGGITGMLRKMLKWLEIS